MKKPTLSIIVPVYNVEKYLDECIDSIRTQILEDIEIILVDDESPDNCPLLCEQYAAIDKRIKVVHKKNGGLGFARNSGLDVATGEYVTFVDSDDKVDGMGYSYLLKKYKELNPDVIYYRYCRFSDKTVPVTKICEPYTVLEKEQLVDLRLDLIASPVTNKRERCIECSSCTSIYKRQLLETEHLRFHSERELISEDMIFNLDVLSNVSKVVLDESELYCYRQNPLSLTRSYRPNKIGQMGRFSQYLIDNYNAWDLPTEEARLRIARLTIGYVRSYLAIILSTKTELKDIKKFYLESVSLPELRDAIKLYPWKYYSLYQKLFYFALRFKSYALAKSLVKIKNIAQ